MKWVVGSALELDSRFWPSWLAETCGDDVEVFLEATTLLAASLTVDEFIDHGGVRLWPGAGRRNGERLGH